MVLADTSVWVGHLRGGEARMAALLDEGEVACHPFVVGELACGHLRPHHEILDLLQSLPAVPQLTDAEALTFIDLAGLQGRGLGLVDVHLLGAARLAQLPLWTLDRALGQVAADLGLAFDG